jgi:hypothetical protein
MFGTGTKLTFIENKLDVALNKIEDLDIKISKLFNDPDAEYIKMVDIRDQIDEMVREFDQIVVNLKIDSHEALCETLNEKSQDLQQAYDNLRVIMNEVRGDLNIFRLVVNKQPKPKAKSIKKIKKVKDDDTARNAI